MEGITIGEIFTNISLVAGVITGVGVILKFVTKLASKTLKNALNEALKPIIEKQTALESGVTGIQLQLKENNLATARVDLFQAITHTPTEHKAILELAEHYFIDLSGNSYMYNEFESWANSQKVDIGYILEKVEEKH